MIEVAAPVREALVHGQAVVALESTLIAHGLPFPDNVEVGLALEAEVSAGGAVPATIAVIDGRCRVGLTAADLERVGKAGRELAKAGAADLGAVVAAGRSAATTVSATARIAARAGIRLFATGGIGGVHRGDSGDVSSDLGVLAREPIAVVSAGAKAILDLPRTLEMLDTLAVPVIGYRTDELPAFYCQRSGLGLEHRADSPEAVAAALRAHWGLAEGGVLIANPIPADAAIAPDVIAAAIDRALAEAERQRVRGKALTPFLLAEIAAVTAGESVRANRALVIHNARVAAEIARALAALAP